MRQGGNQFDFQNYLTSFQQYDNFFAAYQKNISNILTKLRKSRKRSQFLKKMNHDLSQDNNYLRQEIIRLEKEDDKVRDLLSEKTKRLRYLEDNKSNHYVIKYRLRFSDDLGEDHFSDYYDSEMDALNNQLNNRNFIIEKSYRRKDWFDYESEDD